MSREKQSLPEEIVGDLLASIKGQFCPHMGAKEWAQQRRFFMRVVTFPAKELNKQGVTLPAERYKEVLLEIFMEIKRHGDTGGVRFWGGYLLRCVQEHWRHHGHEYYEEGKDIRNAVERATKGLQPTQSAPDPIPSLAATHKLLVNPRAGQRRVKKRAEKQVEFSL